MLDFSDRIINPFEATVKPFCDCTFPKRTFSDSKVEQLECNCGENEYNNQILWVWNANVELETNSVIDNLNVTFHPTYSTGTSIIRGNIPLKPGYIHYWEVKMLSNLSGTDQMFGVGTEDVDLTEFHHVYTSALGKYDNSWAFSYKGHIQHNGKSSIYGNKISRGSIVGVLVDLSLGYMEFFINRRSLGVAFRNIPTDKDVYPMICSTACKSSMRLITSTYFEDSLQYRSYETIVKNGLVKKLKVLPGLQRVIEKYWYLNPRPLISKSKKTEISIEDEIVLLNKMSKRNKLYLEDQIENDEHFDLYHNAFIPPVKDGYLEENKDDFYHFLM